MASPEDSPRIVQLKIRLLGLSHMIWRRVLAPESVTLRDLHDILQVGMGWDGIHLYYFDKQRRATSLLNFMARGRTYPYLGS